MKNKIIGIAILLIVIIGGFIYRNYKPPLENITVKGLTGEKTEIWDNPTIQKILKDKYGLTVEYRKAGSIEMATVEQPDADFLWLSSQMALKLYTLRHPQAKSDIIFSSPVVFFSWDIIADALVKNGIARVEKGVYYVDTEKLARLVLEKKKWSDIGVDQLYGNVVVISSDPTVANSGIMLSGLLASVLNEGTPPDETQIQTVLPDIQTFFKSIGYVEKLSGDLFELYIKTGVGSKPIIAGYENSLIEFALSNPEVWPKVKNKIRILYPEPTVWTSHPFIAKNEKGERLMKALMDPEIQRLSWERHGFRNEVIGGNTNTSIFTSIGIPSEVNKIVGIPNPEVIQIIIDSLKETL